MKVNILDVECGSKVREGFERYDEEEPYFRIDLEIICLWQKWERMDNL